MERGKIKRCFVEQQDQSDCGPACLKMILRFYGGDRALEELRVLSGTSIRGSSLLGLSAAAKQSGLSVECLQAEVIENLSEVAGPCVLHILQEDDLFHFIVFFGFEEDRCLIGDPAKGIIYLTKYELNILWRSRILLTAVPGDNFATVKLKQRRRYQKLLYEILRNDGGLLWASLTLGIFVAAIGISTAFFSQKLVDEILPNKQVEELKVGIVLLGLLLLAKIGLSFLRAELLNIQGLRFSVGLVDKFFSHIYRLPFGFFTHRQSGDIVSRLNDIQRIRQAFTILLSTTLINILVVLIFSGLATYYLPEAGLLLAIGIASNILVAFKFNAKIEQAQTTVLSALAKNESRFVDLLHGIETTKLYSSHEFSRRKITETYQQYIEQLHRLNQIGVKFSTWIELCGSGIFVIMIAYISWEVIVGNLPLGKMIAVMSLSGGVFPAMNAIILANIQVREAKVAYERMIDFMEIPLESEKLDSDSASNVIESMNLYNISFRFPGRVSLFTDVSLQLVRGEIVVIRGGNGVGKSTFLSILAGLQPIDSGIITLDGRDLYTHDRVYYRSKVLMVPQQVRFFRGTLMENLLLGTGSVEQCLSFCNEYGFTRYFENFPEGFLTNIGEGGTSLSGGQFQLVGIARAMMREPAVLLLDEPTSFMDSAMEEFVINLLKDFKHKGIIVLVTHNATTAAIGDRHLVLENGALSKCL